MLTMRARVRHGRFIIDESTDLPEGTEVELVPLLDDDHGPADRAALEASLARSAAQIERGELVDAEEVLASLGARPAGR